MKSILSTCLFLSIAAMSQAQIIQFIIVCNNETNQLEIVLPVDTLEEKYTVIRRKMPNKTMAQKWIDKYYPDGSCNAQGPETEKETPPPPPPPQTQTSSAETLPPKKVDHYYRRKTALMGGWTDMGIASLPAFRHIDDGGFYGGIRWLKGNAVQLGWYLKYSEFGSVRSYEGEDWEEVDWVNFDVGMILSYPIELGSSGKFWLLPEAGSGVSWQNLKDAKPEDYNDNPIGGSWQYHLKASIEGYGVGFSVEYLSFFMEAVEDYAYKFKGTNFGFYISF